MPREVQMLFHIVCPPLMPGSSPCCLALVQCFLPISCPCGACLSFFPSFTKSALLALVYLLPAGHPTLQFNAATMWGVDQFLLGAMIGSVVFFAAGKWYEHIKARNGGHAWFPFQKVVWPLGALAVVTLIFLAIIEWLPGFGIVLY